MHAVRSICISHRVTDSPPRRLRSVTGAVTARRGWRGRSSSPRCAELDVLAPVGPGPPERRNGNSAVGTRAFGTGGGGADACGPCPGCPAGPTPSRLSGSVGPCPPVAHRPLARELGRPLERAALVEEGDAAVSRVAGPGDARTGGGSAVRRSDLSAVGQGEREGLVRLPPSPAGVNLGLVRGRVLSLLLGLGSAVRGGVALPAPESDVHTPASRATRCKPHLRLVPESAITSPTPKAGGTPPGQEHVRKPGMFISKDHGDSAPRPTPSTDTGRTRTVSAGTGLP